MGNDRTRPDNVYEVANQPDAGGLVASDEFNASTPGNGESIHYVWTDQDLVSAVSQGREGAFAELFRRHQRSVATSSRMILGNGSECDDVTAEVFLGLWLNPTKFDGSRGSLLTYLRVQAKGRSIDLIRAEAARSRRENLALYQREQRDEEVGSLVIGSEAGAELRQNMLLLAPHEKEAIELAFFGGMTYAEVARRLDLAEGTVKSRIRRGLEHLRTSMSTQDVEVGAGAPVGADTMDSGNSLSEAEVS